MAGILLALSYCGLCSNFTIGCITGLYFMQLLLYRPHNYRGWPPLLLYSRLTDFVLHYYDGVCLREGPAPDPAGRYMFACYPHGVYGVCRAFSGGNRNWGQLYPGISSRWGSFGMAFFLPGVREFSLFCGCLDAGKPTLLRAINKYKQNVTLLPGGIDEMQLTDGTSTNTQIVMSDRKGYAKLAIETGSDLVPGFCFGEKWVHKTLLLPRWIRAFLYKTFKMSGVLLKGRGPTFLGYLEYPLGFVWGEPIPVRQEYPVTDKYLDEIHGKMQAAVRSIFDRHKKNFGYSDDEVLTFVSVKEARAAQQANKKRQ